jgi:hypothetical protein
MKTVRNRKIGLAGVGLMARRVGEGHNADVTAAGRFSYHARGCDGQLYGRVRTAT